MRLCRLISQAWRRKEDYRAFGDQHRLQEKPIHLGMTRACFARALRSAPLLRRFASNVLLRKIPMTFLSGVGT
jgi:hypothetical protein